MTDSGNDEPSNPQAGSLESGKDLLFGWLVGRAAADLGLAQALAVGEARRAEQFKRLEDSLLAEIHQLKNQQGADAGLTGSDAETLRQVKAELQNVFERMGGLEAAAQLSLAAPDVLKVQIEALQAQWREGQSLVDSHRSLVDEVAQNLGARVLELENKLNSTPPDFNRVLGGFADLQKQLEKLTERVACAETSAEQFRSKTAGDMEQARQLTTELIRAESGALKAAVFEQLNSKPLAEPVLHAVENLLQIRTDELCREFGERTSSISHHDAEIIQLQTGLQNLSAKVDSAIATPPIDFAAERARLSEEVNERIADGIQGLGNEVRAQLQSLQNLHRNLDHLNAEFLTLAARIAGIEGAKEQFGAAFKLELEGLKTELSARQNQAQSVEALFKNVEQVLQTKIQECRDDLVEKQQSLQARDAQFHNFTERMAQRMTETESIIHQTRALMVNSTAQTAQERDGFAAELAALRGQLRDTQAREAVIHGIESRLEAKIDELQNQLVQRMTSMDQRDAEIRELKAQVQSLLRPVPPIETGILPSPDATVHRLQTAEATPFGAVTGPTLVEDRLRSVPLRSESGVLRGQATGRQDDAPQDQVLIEGTDALKVLQARMSADIERARAELKEKSGRWKVRR